MQVLDGIKSGPSVSRVVAELAGVLMRLVSKVPRLARTHLRLVWTLRDDRSGEWEGFFMMSPIGVGVQRR